MLAMNPCNVLRAAGAVTIAAVVMSGCSVEGKTLGQFNVEEDIAETRVQGGGFGALLPTALPPFQLDIESESEFSGEEYSVVNAIHITGIALEITATSEDTDTDRIENGMPDDFSFIESLEFSIEASFDGEVQRDVLASLPSGDPQLEVGGRKLSLITSAIDILPYVEADGGYRLVTSASGTPPADDVYFDGKVDYKVSVGFR